MLGLGWIILQVVRGLVHLCQVRVTIICQYLFFIKFILKAFSRSCKKKIENKTAKSEMMK